MIIYNPKEWWRLIFAFHRSETFRSLLPGIIGVSLFTGAIAFLETNILHVSFKNTTAIHSMVGFVLSLLLVFRTNTAYDRWWEGRKAWGGFVNNTRNLVLKIAAIDDVPHNQKIVMRDLIKNYVFVTKGHLRDNIDFSEVLPVEGYDSTYYTDSNHVPNRTMLAIYEVFERWYKKGYIDGFQRVSFANELQSFTDNLGVCERIRKTPIPYSYSIFLKKIIFLYVFTMPIGFVQEFGYWAMPIVGIVFYVFTGIEVLAEEIEDPFGYDDNDLPTDQISTTIAANLNEIIRDHH
jgi:ion channel-forming bestrophin family protein